MSYKVAIAAKVNGTWDVNNAIKNEVKLKQWVEMIRQLNERGLTVAECFRME